MFSEHPEIDHRLFQYRHRDLEIEAEMERRIRLCEPKQGVVAVPRWLMARVGSAIRAFYQVFYPPYSRAMQAKTEAQTPRLYTFIQAPDIQAPDGDHKP